MSAEQLTRQHWPQIAGQLFPQAVVTDRSAPIGGPTDGVLYLAHRATRDRVVRLPGLTVLARHGLPPQDDDVHCRPLDRLTRPRPGRQCPGVPARSTERPRTLRDDELADWIDDLARLDGLDRFAPVSGTSGGTGSLRRRLQLEGVVENLGGRRPLPRTRHRHQRSRS